MTTTRAAVWREDAGFRLEERTLPEPGPSEVRVAVHACGVCMTDVHTADGVLVKPAGEVVFGHEWSGVVEAVGPDVSGIAVGARVAGTGQGGFADRLVANVDRVYPFSADVPFERAALAEPLAACLAAVAVADVPLGGTVLVTGAGSIGLLTLMLARRAGAAITIVSEPNTARHAEARRLGASAVVDPRAGGLADAVRTSTPGGVDVAFETAGNLPALHDCLASVAARGAVVLVGVHPLSTRLDLEVYPFHRKSLTLKSSYGIRGRGDVEAALRFLREPDVDAMITHRFDLDGVAEAFDLARSGRAGKIIVRLAGA